MANEIRVTTTAFNDIVDQVIAIGRHTFEQVNVIQPLVRNKDISNDPSVTVLWPTYASLGSSDVTAGTEANTFTTRTAITTNVATSTIAEHLVGTSVSRLMENSGTESAIAGAAAELNQAMALQLDNDLATLFQSFAQTVAGAGTTLVIDHVMQALALLAAAGAPRPYHFVGSPKQIWGPKGFSGALDGSAVSSSAAGLRLADQVAESGSIGSVAGVSVNYTTEITNDLATLGDAPAGIFSGEAIGLANKGFNNLFMNEEPDFRGWKLVLQGLWGEIEIFDTWGVYALTDVA